MISKRSIETSRSSLSLDESSNQSDDVAIDEYSESPCKRSKMENETSNTSELNEKKNFNHAQATT